MKNTPRLGKEEIQKLPEGAMADIRSAEVRACIQEGKIRRVA